MPVGTAVVNPDGTITAWLAAQPQSGVLLLRPGVRAALPVNPRAVGEDLAVAPAAGQAAGLGVCSTLTPGARSRPHPLS